RHAGQAHREAAGPVLAVVRRERLGVRHQLRLLRLRLRRQPRPGAARHGRRHHAELPHLRGRRDRRQARLRADDDPGRACLCGSAPTMILSRASFGVTGQKVPGVFSYLISMGWETFLAIMAVLATATVVTKLGGDGGTATKIIAMVVVAALIVAGSVAGYHLIMKLQSVLTWVTGAVTIAYIVLTIGQIDLGTAAQMPSGSAQAMIGALVMVLTGFGLGWVNIAADWSRYQRRDASSGAIVFWNTF